jgi:hypothetical protein
MANLNVIELHAQPLATPIPRSVHSFVIGAFIIAVTAAAGGALVILGLLLTVLAAPFAPVAIAWVLARQRKLDRAWTLRPAGT